jgi:hypothetical protein
VAVLRSVPVVVSAWVVLMILPPAAMAGSGADPSNPSLDQYVESVPTSHGDPPPAGRSGNGRASTPQLPAAIRQRIVAQGGSDATQLERAGSSPAWGAPATRAVPGGRSARGGGRARGAVEQDRPSLLSSLANGATEGGSGGTGALVAGLLLVTGAIGGTALVRRRTTGD